MKVRRFEKTFLSNHRCRATCVVQHLHGERRVIFMPWPLSRHCLLLALARALIPVDLKFSRGVSHKKKKKEKYPPKEFAAREPPTGYRKFSEFPPRTDIYFTL
jgi:hypothetical protein